MDKILDAQLMADLFGETAKPKESTTERLNKPVYEFSEAKKEDKPLPTVEKKENFSSYRPELLAAEILRNAVYNSDLLGLIKERASIRWSEGLSDSLFEAVLCNIAQIDEQPERDKDGQIVLRPRINWNEELAKYKA